MTWPGNYYDGSPRRTAADRLVIGRLRLDYCYRR